MHRLLLIIMNLFIISCVFDPADTVLGLKVPLFCLSWLVFILYTRSLNNLTLPKELVFYVFAMIFLPLLSIFYYYISNGSQPYEGFSLLKAHILISFAILLYLSKINLLDALSRVLTLLAIAIIIVYVVVLIYPSLYIPLYIVGLDTGIFSIGEREYSEDVKMWSIFFVTSPMLAISIAYYMHKAIKSQKKLLYILLAFINIFAMFIAGTRNNMLVAILLPVVLLVLNSRYRKLISIIAIVLIVAVASYFSESINAMINPEEASNKVKLDQLDDYSKIFSDPINLMFGQGLGSYTYWPSRDNAFRYITEHTYLEIIRNFGIFMGGLLIALMFYPVLYAFYMNRSFREKHIIMAYIFYLAMSITNPLFFSSLGMLILSIIIANIFIEKYNVYQVHSS